MLLSHIEHYLTPEGIKIFPNWYIKLKNIFMKQDGFISIKYAHDREDANCVHIWTEFSDEEKADGWAKSQIKNYIQSRLDLFRTKPMRIERYTLIDAAFISSCTHNVKPPNLPHFTTREILM